MSTRFRRQPVVLALTFTVSMLSASPASASPIVKGPYLHDLSKDAVEVRLEAETALPASLEISPEGEDAGAARVVRDDARTFHVFHVDKLVPASRYRYTVTVGEVSSSGSFTTAPPDDATAHFHFVAYGDTRSNADVHASIVASILKGPADFVVHTGDYVQSGGDAAEWQTFFSIEAPLIRDRCVFAAVGNHELYEDTGGSSFLRYFGPDAGDKKLYGSFRWGNTRFFMLNTFPTWDPVGQKDWLQRELTKADTEAGLVWRIVVIHHGPYSAGRHGSNIIFDETHAPELLAAHHVDLVLSGHDHIYERGESRGTGLRYVISGGAGAPLYAELHPLPSTIKVEPTYHYVDFEVTKDVIKLVATRPDGTMVNRCSFGHTPGWDCGEKEKAKASSTAAATQPPAQNGAKVTPPSEKPPARASSSSGCSCRASPAEGGVAALALGSLAVVLARARRGRRAAR